jgi:hypothetical protein
MSRTLTTIAVAIILALFAVSSTATVSAQRAAVRLVGHTGALPESNSGWLDLAAPTKFNRGETIRLVVGGTASHVMVRFLPVGFSPNAPDVIVERNIAVPKNRTIDIVLTSDYKDIGQVSVHGGVNPFDRIFLGTGNGPATLEKVERIKS